MIDQESVSSSRWRRGNALGYPKAKPKSDMLLLGLLGDIGLEFVRIQVFRSFGHGVRFQFENCA
jgi:hypothetical protein